MAHWDSEITNECYNSIGLDICKFSIDIWVMNDEE